ncbi:MAG TPA: universal stress protein [Thermoleophilia bacterium]|nr:universal stress protein [Thermoleophilia bacterium]
MFRRILVPSDGSEHALKAVRVAVDLAKEFDSEVVLLAVVPVPQTLVMVAGISEHVIDDYIERAGRDALQSALDVFEEAGLGVEVKIEVGSAGEEILRQAQEAGVDVIVMGKRGLGGVKGLLLGSVSNRVTHGAPIPVLLIP